MSSPPISDWPRMHRRAFLEGGLQAYCPAGSDKFEVTFGKELLAGTMPLTSYRQFFSIFQQSSIRTIGFQSYETENQVEGMYPPGWRMWSQSKGWAAYETHHSVGNAAKNLLNNNRMYEYDICQRVKNQLQISELRMLSLSEAYGRMLNAAVRFGSERTGSSYSDGWLTFISMEAHGLLNDLGTLRDYVSELISALIISNSYANRWSTAATFIKRYKCDFGSNEVADAFYNECTSVNPSSLKEMGLYRDLITHSSPLDHATDFFAARIVELKLFNTDTKALKVLLPDGVETLVNQRSKGLFPKSKTDWLAEREKNWNQASSEGRDCLTYLHNQLEKLVFITKNALDTSGVDVAMQSISLDDTSGPIRFGTVRQV